MLYVLFGETIKDGALHLGNNVGTGDAGWLVDGKDAVQAQDLASSSSGHAPDRTVL